MVVVPVRRSNLSSSRREMLAGRGLLIATA
jgi:hypothetical protein